MVRIRLSALLLLISLVLSTVIVSCSSDHDLQVSDNFETPSTILSKHVWITTKVTDNKGNDLDISVMPASMYAGYAYYRSDGTFRIVDFQDQPKMFGEWSLTDNNTKRHLVVYKSDNTIAYERTVDLVEFNNSVFTYRISDSNDPSIIYNVEHKPVNHPEPKTPAEVLASVNWTTTKVLDITNGVEVAQELDRTQPPAANFSGDAYYINEHGNAYFPKNSDGEYANGTFLITAYGDKNSVRSRGDWYVSVDGKQRFLIAKNESGAVLWRRAVSIPELTAEKFTYDIQIDGGRTLRVEHEPIKE